jgi:hypothetical protein
MAEKMHRRALEGRKKVLGIKYLNILNSIYNLALIFRFQGKYVTAEEMHRSALKKKDDAGSGIFKHTEQYQ